MTATWVCLTWIAVVVVAHNLGKGCGADLRDQLAVGDRNSGQTTTREQQELETTASLNSALSGDDLASATLGLKVLSSPIRFEPREVDFGEQPMGMPVIREVVVFNVNEESSIEMLSISGNSIHFHCSFFSDKVIPPLGNTSFEVVFLGREEGLVENTLYVHTSAGSFRLLVQAKAIANPYRLKPLVGVKIPVNASYSPVIEMHNPHDQAIQIVEMYSSGGDLHLELPSGDTEGPQGVWIIPAHRTKMVMRATFLAREENNHTAYIRIKTNTTASDFLYVPLEVEVSSKPNLYSHQEALDFGLLSTSDPIKTLRVLVSNSASKPITIQSVSLTPNTTANQAISVVFESIKMPPKTLEPIEVAQVALDPSKIDESGLVEGSLFLRSKQSQYSLSIKFKAAILKGNLSTDEHQTYFHLPSLSPHQTTDRSLIVENTFGSPIALHGIEVCDESMITFTSNYTSSLVLLKPGEKRLLGMISLKKGVKDVGREEIVVHTNVSDLHLPILVYHGLLNTFVEGEVDVSLIDIGLLGFNATRSFLVTLFNPNPLAIGISKWNLDFGDSEGSIDYIGQGEGTRDHIKTKEDVITSIRGSTSFNGRVQVVANGFAVFRLSVYSSDKEGSMVGKIVFETDFEEMTIDIKGRVAKGQLQSRPRTLVLTPTFPGSVGNAPLVITSSFSESMSLISLSVSPKVDKRFYFMANTSSPIIEAGKTTSIGTLYFDPALRCAFSKSCYTGFDIDSELGSTWLEGLRADHKTVKSDLDLSRTQRELFDSMLEFNSTISVIMNTDKVQSFGITAKASLVMPSVILDRSEKAFKNTLNPTSHSYAFPLTQVGNSSSIQIEFINPSSTRPVFFQIVPATEVQEVAHLDLSRFIRTDSGTRGATRDSNPFELASVSGSSSPLQTFVDLIDEDESSIPALSKLFVLQPNQRARAHLKFRPQASSGYSQIYFVRNNLTWVEVIDVAAEGTMGDLQFGVWNSAFGGQATINYEVTEKHLRDCADDTRRNRFAPPVVTVKRSFRLQNHGRTSVYVKRFNFDDNECEGHGFRVLNCQPFTLRPEEWRDIDIAFTPDFTLSLIRRRFSIESTLSKPNDVLNFTIEVSIPHHMLAHCQEALPRPSWETPVYYGVNVVMTLMLIVIIVAAVFESSRIFRSSRLYAPETPLVDKRHLLDLKKVQNEVMEELRLRITQKKQNDHQQRLSETSSKKAHQKQRKTNHNNNNIFGKESSKKNVKNKVVDDSRDGICQSAECNDIPMTHDDAKGNDSPWSRTMAWITNKTFRPIGPQAVNNEDRKRSVSNEASTSKLRLTEKPTSLNKEDPLTKESKTSESGTPDSSNTPIAATKKSKKRQVARALNKMDTEKHNSRHSANINHNNNTINVKCLDEIPSVVDSADCRGPSNCDDSQSNVEETEDEVNSFIQPRDVSKRALEVTSASKNGFSKSKSRSKKKNSIKKETKEIDDDRRRDVADSKMKKKKDDEPTKKREDNSRSSSVMENTATKSTRQQQVAKTSTEKTQSTSKTAVEDTKPPPLPSVSFSSKLEQKSNVKAPPPVGKILPEPKRPENLGAHYGPVGAKMPQQRSYSSWSDSPARAQPFSSPSVDRTTVLSAGYEQNPRSNTSVGFSSQSNHSTLNASNSLGLISSGSPTRSLMQTLQDERRQRTEEYLRNTKNWPGFDQSPADFFANLWDRPQPSLTATPNGWGNNAWPANTWSADPELMNNVEQSRMDQNKNNFEDNVNNGVGFANSGSFNPLASPLWDHQPLVPRQEEANTEDGDVGTWSAALFSSKK